MKRQLYLIAYDIQCNRRRRHTLYSIKGNAVGGQKSLYECWLSKVELGRELDSLRTRIDGDVDKVLVIRLDSRALMHTVGIAVEPPDGDFFYQG